MMPDDKTMSTAASKRRERRRRTQARQILGLQKQAGLEVPEEDLIAMTASPEPA